MPTKVEYLITYNIKGNTLETIDNFKHLLMSNSLISFNDDKLSFDSTEFNFELITHVITDRKQRIFKICISINEIGLIDKMSELLKIIRESVNKTEGRISVLWDEISNYYSSLAYPEINKIENLLRKLITYFMITNFGNEWVEDNIPNDVKNGVKKNREKNNFLHDTDFIQLSDFLFKAYPSDSIELLFKDIKNKKLNSNIDYSYFEKFVPRSNWERYFNQFVDCEDGFLSKKWNKLYDLRCLIAHNNFLNKNEYEEIIELVNSLIDKFEKAIKSIDEIIIPGNEKEAVLESVLKARNEKLSSFFNQWHLVSDEINKLCKSNNIDFGIETTLGEAAQNLVSKKIVNEKFYLDLKTIGEFRNKLINRDEVISDEEINNFTALISNFYLEKFRTGENI